MWKKVDITKYPFNLLDETWDEEVYTDKEAQILMDILSDELGGQHLEFFDSETSSAIIPPIPEEFKRYWQKWFYLNLSFVVTGYRNPKLGKGWCLIEFEGLLPIIIRPAKTMFGISSNSNHRAKTMKMLGGMGIKYKKDGRNGLIILGVAPKDQKGILDKIHRDIGMTTYRIMDNG